MHLVQSKIGYGYDFMVSKIVGELLAWQFTLFCSKEGKTHNILFLEWLFLMLGSEIWDIVRAASFALSCGCLLFPWLNFFLV